MGSRASEATLTLPDRIDGLRAASLIIQNSLTEAIPLSAIWLNIDRFRQINDSFGHAGGDAVLAEIIARMRRHLGPGDLLARMGGDEFLCVLCGSEGPDADKVAYGLLHDIRRPLRIDELLFRPSVSMGVATSAGGSDASRLIEAADRAMFEAKRLGGGRLIRSNEGTNAAGPDVHLARAELVTENALHTALENGGLRLHYQPIIDFEGRIQAFEALMRCRVNGRDIPPGHFIPVAEKTGLIVQLGEWCLTEGARFAARLRREWRPATVAINVSRAQVTSPFFMSALHGALICSDIPPGLIDLEITESLFMELSSTVHANLRSVREAGLGLSIDDFGTGFSCLANLKDLPATKIKLDRAFIDVLPQDSKALAVVRAMSILAKDLGFAVIAEGVETAAQLECLRNSGVDAVQGYLYSRPLTDDALLQWLPASGYL